MENYESTTKNDKKDNGIEKEKKIPKKRGRKPKGGKVIMSKPIKKPMDEIKKNIILHLKCSSKDIKETSFFSELTYNPVIEYVEAYEDNELNQFTNVYHHKEIEINVTDNMMNNEFNSGCENSNTNLSYTSDVISSYETKAKLVGSNAEINQNEISNKLKQLQKNFFHNMSSSKKSKCFWCTCDFESQVIYIPKCKLDNSYEVYGCFCTPECGVAYLYNESIDTSSKWERYALMHSLYSKIFEYEGNIKPAPDPRYLLDCYFGNLTIDEFRSIHKRPNSISILDKPITRLLPEIIESSYSIDIHNRFHQSDNNNTIKKYRLARNDKGYKPSNPFDLTNNFWKDIKQ